MSVPTISCIVPTAGRASLARTLDSLAGQMLDGDECLVVGDVLNGPLPQSEAICAAHPWCRYIPFTDGLMSWGHNQINYALMLVKGDLIHGNDDDDVYTPTALAAMRDAGSTYPGRVLLFRFQAYFGNRPLVWVRPGVVMQGAVGGHCLVLPNIPDKVGCMSDRYEGDYDWILDTLRRHELPPVWVDHVICIQRPDEPQPVTLPPLATPEEERPHLTARPVVAVADILAMGRIRNAQRAAFSHDQTPIDDARQLAWWREHHLRLRAWLYTDCAGATVGYTCLRQEEDGRWWSSVAVMPGHEGHGYGKAITTHCVLAVEHPVWGAARNDQPGALKLHDDLIWDTIGADESLTYFRSKPKIVGGA